MRIFQRIKCVLAGLLTAALMLPWGIQNAAAYYTSYYDDTYGHWAEDTIEKWSVDYGILGGYSDGTFRPDNTITRGAFAGILCRFLGYEKESPVGTFSDTAGSSWEDEILKLNAAGVYLGNNGMAQPGSSISRQQALTMICRALQVPESDNALIYADSSEVSGYAKGYLAALTDRGSITDVGEDNRFRPADAITRAEVVNLLDKIVLTVLQESQEFSDVVGTLLITAADGAYLKNAVVYGDLLIGPGVTGTVTLDNTMLIGELRNLGGAAVTVIEQEEPEWPKQPEPEEPEEPPVYEHKQTTIAYNGDKIPVKQDVKPSTLGPGDFRWENGRLVCDNPDFTTRFGIDVSINQNRASNGQIDWDAVAADGVDFAMVRVGYRGTSEGSLYVDEYYGKNIDGAMAAGIDTGVYFFSQAITVEEAIEEADLVIALLRNHPISGPVAFDWEMKDSSYRVYGTPPEVVTACAKAFCERIEEAGYEAMIYFSKYVGYYKLDLSQLRGYSIWYPEYRTTANTSAMLYPSFYYQVDVWQYSDRLVVDGIGGVVDGNIWLIPVEDDT